MLKPARATTPAARNRRSHTGTSSAHIRRRPGRQPRRVVGQAWDLCSRGGFPVPRPVWQGPPTRSGEAQVRDGFAVSTVWKALNRVRFEASGLVARVPGRTPCFWIDHVANFGDQLTRPLLADLFGIRPQIVHRRFAGKVLGCGSVIEHVRPGDVVWGSGSLFGSAVDASEATVLAVRGPKTRMVVKGDVPEVYGDPGMLLPLIYTPRHARRRYDVGLVPHMCDHDALVARDPAVLAIDVRTRDWRRVVDQIASCDVIVSSSLHGIVVAEAYGVPAVWVQPTGRLQGGRFKFDDWYEGTGREARSADWSAGLSVVVAAAGLPPPLDAAPLLASASTYWRTPGAS